MNRLARVDYTPVEFVAQMPGPSATNAFGQEVIFSLRTRQKRVTTLQAITMQDHPKATLVTNPIAAIKTRKKSPTKRSSGRNRTSPSSVSQNV